MVLVQNEECDKEERRELFHRSRLTSRNRGSIITSRRESFIFTSPVTAERVTQLTPNEPMRRAREIWNYHPVYSVLYGNIRLHRVCRERARVPSEH